MNTFTQNSPVLRGRLHAPAPPRNTLFRRGVLTRSHNHLTASHKNRDES